MKIKYSSVKSLSNHEIIEGIIHCHNNSESLYKSSLALKKDKKFNVATSILILSIEELIKGLILYFLLIFEKNEDNEKFLKDFFDSRNLHATRLELALVMSQTLKNTNHKNLMETEVEIPEDLSNALISEIDMLKITEELQNEKKIINNWFKHANSRKNAGLYVSCNNGKWITPETIGEKEFLNAFNETKEIRKFTKPLFEGFIEMNKEEIEYCISFWKEMGKSLISKLDAQDTISNSHL